MTPELGVLQRAVVELVLELKEQEIISGYTVNMVREHLESSLKLEQGSLKVFKKELSMITKHAAIAETDDVDKIVATVGQRASDTKVEEPKSNSKRIDDDSSSVPSSPIRPTARKKRKSRTVTVVQDSEDEDEDGVKDEPADEPAPKKVKTSTTDELPSTHPKFRTEKAAKVTKDAPAPIRKNSKKYKSAAVVADSDDDEVGSSRTDSNVTKVAVKSNSKVIMNHADNSASEEVAAVKTKIGKVTKVSASTTSAATETKKAKTEATSSKKSKDSTSTKKKHKSATGDSKHDATIKRLKSLILACGVRKVWAKDFAAHISGDWKDNPTAQIKRLKEILHDELGMPARASIEKAKQIREERELQQDVADAQMFHKATLARGPRLGRSTSTSGQGDSDDEGGDEKAASQSNNEYSDAEAVASVKKKRAGPSQLNAARKSITAFLGDSD